LHQQGRFVLLRDFVVTSGRKVRTHTSWELLWGMAKLAIGPRVLRDRSRLALWYGPRRRDET
jgi:hypothetical protein